MALRQDFDKCAFCFQPFGPAKAIKNGGHIIPKSKGGCDHAANMVDICRECNAGEDGQGTLTPIEFWAKQNWAHDGCEDEESVSMFDSGGWTLKERQEYLLQAAYWEARARWHQMKWPHPDRNH